MFESIVTDLLVKHLGQYVTNLETKNLKLGIWGGDVQLKDLMLRTDALDSLNLPVGIQYGIIGNLVLKVPWKSLRSKPVVVEVSDVLLVVAPSDIAKLTYDEAKERAKALQQKMDALDQAEMMRKMREEATEGKSKGFAERLVTTIIGNLQVNVKNVHVRYEARNHAGELFAFGLTLDALKIQSTDAEGNVRFIDPDEMPHMHKLVELRSLAVYLDRKVVPLAEQDGKATRRLLIELIAKVGESNDELSAERRHEFVLRPMMSSVRAIINDEQVPNMKVPKIQINADFPALELALEERQYGNVLCVMETLTEFSVTLKNLKHRPANNVRPTKDPRAWWRYAGNMILDDVRDKLRRRSANFVLEQMRMRNEYVQLYKRNSGVKWLAKLSDNEAARMRKLEETLTYEQVILFRSFASAELKVERAKAEKIDSKKKEEHDKKGFFGRLWSSPSAKPTKEEVALDSDDKAAIYKSIGFEDVKSDFKAPKEYVQTAISVSLGALRVALRSGEDELVKAIISSLSAKVAQRPDSVVVDASLGTVSVQDEVTVDSCFPEIVSRSPPRESKDTDQLTITSKQSLRASAPVDDLITVHIEQNPLDGHADLMVVANMRPLDVIVNKVLLDRLASFFDTDEPVEFTNARDRVNQSMESLKENTRLQMDAALEKHQTMDIRLHVAAPVVMVPEDVCKEDSMMLVADLGALHVQSVLADKADKKAKERDEDDYYDKFDIRVADMAVLLADHGQEWWQSAVANKRDMHLLHNMSVLLSVKKCIDPTEMSLPKMKVSGSVPDLSVVLSTKRYNKLMRLAAVFGADADADGADNKAEVKAIEEAPPSPRMPRSPRTLTSGAATLRGASKTNGSATLKRPTTPAKGAKKVSKADEMKMRRQLAKRVELQLDFSVREVNIRVWRDLHVKKPSEMIRLQVTGLGAEVTQRTYSMNAAVALKELTLHDCVQKSGDRFAVLATSRAIDTSASAEERLDSSRHTTVDSKKKKSKSEKSTNSAVVAPMHGGEEKFIHVKVEQLSKESPAYDGVDMDVSGSFAHFYVLVNRDTVSELIRFALIDLPAAAPKKKSKRKGVSPRASPRKKKKTLRKGTSRNKLDAAGGVGGGVVLLSPRSRQSTLAVQSAATVNAAEETAADGVGEVSTSMRVKFELGQVGLMLNKEGELIADFMIDGIGVSASMRTNDTLDAAVRLRSIHIDDLVSRQQCLYSRMLAPTDDSKDMLTAKYAQFSKKKQGDAYPGWDAALEAQMESMKLVVAYDFVLDIQNYFLEGPIMTTLLAAGAESARAKVSEAAVEAAKDPVPVQRIKLDIKLNSFFVEVPERLDSTNSLLIDLGVGDITNRFADNSDGVPLEYISAQLSKLSIVTKCQSGGGAALRDGVLYESYQMLNSVSATLNIVRLLQPECTKVPQMAVSMHLGTINFFFSSGQYKQIMATLSGNLKQLSEPVASVESEKQVKEATEAQKLLGYQKPAHGVTTGTMRKPPAAANLQVSRVRKVATEPPRIVVDDSSVSGETKERKEKSEKKEKSSVTVSVEKAAAAVFRKLEASIELDEIGVALLTGDGVRTRDSAKTSLLTLRNAVEEREHGGKKTGGEVRDDGLVIVALSALKAHVTMDSDGAMDANLRMRSLVGHDIRSHTKSHFRRLFGPTDMEVGDDEERQQIFATVTRDSEENTVVGARVRFIRLYAVPSIIDELLTFVKVDEKETDLEAMERRQRLAEVAKKLTPRTPRSLNAWKAEVNKEVYERAERSARIREEAEKFIQNAPKQKT